MGIPWDGTGINCYGMGQINMSHGQPCESVDTTLTQKQAVFPAFSSREVTIGQMRKIGIHFIIYRCGEACFT